MPANNIRFNLRYDLDVAQRCLFVVCAYWFSTGFLNFILPSVIYAYFSGIFLFAGFVALIGAVIKSAVQFKPDGKAVLVTGCDSGFGLALAKDLAFQGFKVYAGCLTKSQNGKGPKDLEGFGKRNNVKLQVLQLDVTKEEDWKAVVAHIEKDSPDGLWGLVNNAGWSTFGFLEWVPISTYRKIFEVNVLGIVRGTQICLPLVRKTQGRVVTMTSIMGRMTAPSRSPYIMSKFAISSVMDCLRHEMENFGVKVSTIEAGNYLAGTSLFNESIVTSMADEMWKNMSEEVKSSYGEDGFKDKIKSMKDFIHSGLKDISPVVKAYSNSLLDVFPQKRYLPMEMYFRVRVFIATHLPEIFYDYFYFRMTYLSKNDTK